MDASTIQADPAGAFNLAQYEASESAVFEPINPKTGEKLLGADGQPVRIELYGPASEQYLRAQAQIEAAMTERAVQSFMANKGKQVEEKGDPAADAENSRADRIKKLIACTKSISPNFPVAAADLFTNPRLAYLTNQAAAFMENWSHFLP